MNSNNGFVNPNQFGFSGQDQFANFEAPQGFTRGGQSPNRKQQQQDEPVVAWLNIRVALANGEYKQLGKGIPLRESVALERAILDLMESDGFEANHLKGAIDIRINGSTDNKEDVKIDLFSAISTTTTEEKTPAPRKRTPRAKAVEADLADE